MKPTRDYEKVLQALDRLIELLSVDNSLLSQIEALIRDFPKEGTTRNQQWRFKQLESKVEQARNLLLNANPQSIS